MSNDKYKFKASFQVEGVNLDETWSGDGFTFKKKR
jgi:hypothetical protein